VTELGYLKEKEFDLITRIAMHPSTDGAEVEQLQAELKKVEADIEKEWQLRDDYYLSNFNSKTIEISTNNAAHLAPPSRLGDWLLLAFMPKKDRVRLVDDLHEEYYHEIVPRVGQFGARAWYWVQVRNSLWPIIGGNVTKFFKWLATDGWEIIKRMAGG